MSLVDGNLLRIDAANPFYTKTPRDVVAGLVEGAVNVLIGSLGACASLVVTLVTTFREKPGKGMVKHFLGGFAFSSFLALFGATSAVIQFLRGAVNTPRALKYYVTNRKMWDADEARWKSYALLSEYNYVIEKGSFEEIISNARARCEADFSYQHNTAKDNTLYERLGVDQNASFDEIKVAYFQLALTQHPDKNPSPDATRNFQSITEAYRVLSNPKLRQQYNADGLDSQQETTLDRMETMRSEAVTKILYLFGGKAVHVLIGPGVSYFYFLEGTWLTCDESKQLNKIQALSMALISTALSNVFSPGVYSNEILQGGFDLLNEALSDLGFPVFSLSNPLGLERMNEIIELIQEAPLGRHTLYLIGAAYVNMAEDFLASQEKRYGSKLFSKFRRIVTAIHSTARMSLASASLARNIIHISRKINPKEEAETRQIMQTHMPRVSHQITNILWYFWSKSMDRQLEYMKGLLFYDASIDRKGLVARSHALASVGEYLKVKGEAYEWSGSSVDILSYM
ncbi:DnaJ domain-containing protein [Perkinsela sp. CCAP 1560/4]|nr:DnaJ domain-containing protein [Perkinsela sp. CCAP 1560/4]|eukprot:KNH09791.1 DnaJ domain-containing protein [Perkinsela sp. CCAP 1560/4]